LSDGIGIGDFESRLLQIFAVIEHRAADEKRALWIDDQVTFCVGTRMSRSFGPSTKIHHVLQAGAAAADHLRRKRPVGLPFSSSSDASFDAAFP
jgi:hypothetical protein